MSEAKNEAVSEVELHLATVKKIAERQMRDLRKIATLPMGCFAPGE